MTRRLVIITEIISPYRIPLFNALAQHPEVDLHVVFLAETDPALRQWKVYKDEIKFSYQVLPSYRKRIGRYNALLNLGVGRTLSAAKPDVILCGGYSYVASWRALFWARTHGVPFLLWSESNLQDMRRGQALVELLKGQFLRQCTGFVVPGRSASDFLRAHRIKEDVIFTAVNAVDNDLFAAASCLARQNATQLRAQLGLPDRYFLFVGRLVREKGIFELLSAYATLEESLQAEIGLVFVGDGDSRSALEHEAASVSQGVIRFAGFAEREQLAIYFALAEMLVLPTYTDTWGLVVNEAMACGLPVIVSRVAGCAADLVTDEWNGQIVPPKDVPSLVSAMRRLATQNMREAMGANSMKRIADYSPVEWSSGIVRMMRAVGASLE
jgi:1,2-diacylglycerol 3-alpha-glucosyltransferase